MKLKLINPSKSEKEGLYQESPSLIGLDTNSAIEPADWVKEILELSSWQGNAIRLEKLKMLLRYMPEDLMFGENTNNLSLVSWEIDDKRMEVDLSLILSQLINELFIIEDEKIDLNKLSLVLE